MKFIPDQVMRTLAKQVLVAKKYAPNILFVGGIAGIVGSTVLACRATLKLDNTLDEFKENIHKIEMKAIANADYAEDKQYKADVGLVYIKGSYSIVKLYAPAVIVGVASIGALTGSHVTLMRRNTSLMAAYAALSNAYTEYRERVKRELGNERELDIYHAVSIEKFKDEDGKTAEIKSADPNKWSPYARFFDEASPYWQKNPELNRIYVQVQQNYLNHLLQVRGHVFLNEAYDQLGLERSKAGQVVGWMIGNGGDNYIDFGLYEATSSRFVNGIERNILLDFNVDGVIFDKI